VETIFHRWMGPEEIGRIAEIDRAEQVRIGYEVQEGELSKLHVQWDIPNFIHEGKGEHTLQEQIDFCQGHLDRGGIMIGAFQGEALVGIGLLQPEIRDGLAQLAYLHVSSGYRRLGVGSRLMEEMLKEAKNRRSERIYVSATPTESAVGFYLSHGFHPVETPIPELFDLEPEDIHMVKALGR
jgi:ribosomal protein S18 acetylase RimI-like enzyme